MAEAGSDPKLVRGYNATVDARRYERSVAPHTRAKHGLFYTPDPLADRLVWAALGEWLAQRGVPFERAWALFASGTAPGRGAAAARRALAGLVVVDPSCGAGALLAAAGRAIARAGAALGARPSARLVGTDRDAAAIALARTRLAAAGATLVEVGDALDPRGPTGDVVLTNPPYGSAQEGAKTRAGARGDVDRYVTFWRAAAARVKDGGVLAVLAPTSWRTGQRYRDARRTVIEPSGLATVLLVPRGAFPDAYVDTCVAICHAGRPCRDVRVAQVDLGTMSPPAAAARVRAPAPAAEARTESIDALFRSTRGVLAIPAARGGERLLVGPVAAFAWPADPRAFSRVLPGGVREGAASLALSHGPRLLVRRIVGRSERLTCLVVTEPAVVKKDFYVLVPRVAGVSLHAYAALLHARPVARAVAAREVASTKNDFAQLSLAVLRDLRVPLLPRPGTRARATAKATADAALDVADAELASAWLETRALEGRRIGRELLESRVRRIDADERWTVLRARLDDFAARFVDAWGV